MKSPTQALSPADAGTAIKQKLLARKWSVTELARIVGRSRKATSVAIHHPARLPKLRARIEEVLS